MMTSTAPTLVALAVAAVLSGCASNGAIDADRIDAESMASQPAAASAQDVIRELQRGDC